MALVSLTCWTCDGKAVVTTQSGRTISCDVCCGVGSILVHTGAFDPPNTAVSTGTNSDSWGIMWKCLDDGTLKAENISHEQAYGIIPSK